MRSLRSHLRAVPRSDRPAARCIAISLPCGRRSARRPAAAWAAVHARNGNVAGGDPAALRMLIAGEIQFYTADGRHHRDRGAGGRGCSSCRSRSRSAAQAHKAHRRSARPLIGDEMAAKGMHLFPHGGFDNGMRQVASVARAVATPDDLAGMRIRVPPGQLIFDTFQAFGAEPVIIPATSSMTGSRPGRWRRRKIRSRCWRASSSTSW